MPRSARIMLTGVPFHITHRGNHRKKIFHGDSDCETFRSILKHYSDKFEMSVWAYCLMPNHIHLIAVGQRHKSIASAIGNTCRAYSHGLNRDRGVTGHLWANRYFSAPMDEPYSWMAARYVELNPVRARITDRATDFPWSSARANAGLSVDALLSPERPFPGPIEDWEAWLQDGLDDATLGQIRHGTNCGRPLGSDEFVSDLQNRLGHKIRRTSRKRRK